MLEWVSVPSSRESLWPSDQLIVHAWRIPWTEKPGGLWSIQYQRIRNDWNNLAQFTAILYLSSYKMSKWECDSGGWEMNINWRRIKYMYYLWGRRLTLFDCVIVALLTFSAGKSDFNSHWSAPPWKFWRKADFRPIMYLPLRGQCTAVMTNRQRTKKEPSARGEYIIPSCVVFVKIFSLLEMIKVILSYAGDLEKMHFVPFPGEKMRCSEHDIK